ncbi:hypothetical protein HMF8227_02164 [Saliniradius amylolyticus]|uniref:DUF962 domain-containing protein n=1 Tax=Saliniradius amylolyticus TaxID=2183582 RepID=A0A2S2E522_9ALTE|nr:DUF962 domain-containing protein [Saliniradius amylolyticus]AWL12622.1 hypothetical protein HMF8227_02164 [Saliniradius amylolyticus]
MSFKSFADFYPYYLQEHSDKRCRALHYIGSTLVLGILVYSLWNRWWWGLLLMPVVGYGFAWIGHFLFEHNRPATFRHPWYSLLGDWVMYKDAGLGLLGVDSQLQRMKQQQSSSENSATGD